MAQTNSLCYKEDTQTQTESLCYKGSLSPIIVRLIAFEFCFEVFAVLLHCAGGVFGKAV